MPTRAARTAARAAPIAVAAVYVTSMGTVARCPHCDGVLATFVEADDGRVWFGMPGITALEVAR